MNQRQPHVVDDLRERRSVAGECSSMTINAVD
jgi:hypothetical protein